MTSTIDKVIASIPEREVNQDKITFTTSAGVVFRLKPVPPLLVSDARAGYPVPMPPRVMNEDKGVLEENIHDPTYKAELAEYRDAISEVTNAVILTRGTEIVSLPDGYPRYDDEEWAGEIQELTKLVIPKVGKRRYYCWLKWVALEKMDDFTGLLNAVSAAGGKVMEEAVAKATEEFRRDEERAANPGTPVEEADGHGDNGNQSATGSGN